MKKHNEGYALAFVLVVIVVLSLVALSISSVALNNLKNQHESIKRMQDKYAAQGEIEIVLAQLGQCDRIMIKQSGEEYSLIDPEGRIKLPANTSLSIKVNGETTFTADFTITSKVNTATIECVIHITAASTLKGQLGVDYSYTFEEIMYEYASYNISTSAEGGAGNES